MHLAQTPRVSSNLATQWSRELVQDSTSQVSVGRPTVTRSAMKNHRPTETISLVEGEETSLLIKRRHPRPTRPPLGGPGRFFRFALSESQHLVEEMILGMPSEHITGHMPSNRGFVSECDHPTLLADHSFQTTHPD